MTLVPSNRRRFLQTSLAAGALGTWLGVGPSRGDEPGVDAGPFATENPTIPTRTVTLIPATRW